MGSGCLPTPTFPWVCEPVDEPGAGARPGRVTHCCFEHAGQNFGSLDRGPQATRPVGSADVDWRTSELKQEPEEIPDAEHELVHRAGRRDRCGQGVGQGVRAAAAGAAGRRFSRVWDVAATHRRGQRAGRSAAWRERIEKVTVESTSDYWRIWYYLLEAAGLSVQLVNARDVKNVPGPAENRQARRGLAGQADREGAAAALFRAAGTDPAAARLHPAAGRSDPGTVPATGSGWRSCSRTR